MLPLAFLSGFFVNATLQMVIFPLYTHPPKNPRGVFAQEQSPFPTLKLEESGKLFWNTPYRNGDSVV